MPEIPSAEHQITALTNANGVQRKRNSQQSKVPVVSATSKLVHSMPKPLNKEVCEKIIKTVMDDTFEGFTYMPKSSLQLCAEVSDEIKNRIKAKDYDRYRYVVVVSIGEKLMQGIQSLVKFLWDAENDGYLSYAVDTPKFFAIATLYYIYYD